MPTPIYKRILLKLSGEAFKGNTPYGIDADTLEQTAKRVKVAHDMGVEIAIVVGGGNIWRGASAQREGFDRASADYAGMLATVINAISLQDALEQLGIDTRVQTAINIQQVAEPFIRRKAIRHMEKGRIVILAGGTGNPYMTTDTAAALRSIELSVDLLVMSKNKVDGVYDLDPRKNPNAKKFKKLTFREAINRNLTIMDTTALTMCMENKIAIKVFDIFEGDSLEKLLNGEEIGTTITVD
jgi:uridylate kinase